MRQLVRSSLVARSLVARSLVAVQRTNLDQKSHRTLFSSAGRRTVRVFWDLDNKHVAEVENEDVGCQFDNRIVPGLRWDANSHVAKAIATVAGARGKVEALEAFGNHRTWTQSKQLARAVEAADFHVHRVPNIKEAADRAIETSARTWIEEASCFRAQLTLVLVSDDYGFDGLLRVAKPHSRIVTISKEPWYRL